MRVDSAHASVRAILVPKVLEWTLGGNYSAALGRIKTKNPTPPTSGSAAQNATATAKPMPAFEDSLLRVETALKYHFWKAWTADTLNPFVPGVTSIWLGNDLKDYAAHIVAVTLGYRFK